MIHKKILTHIRAIIGLGNPGTRYYYTRHSIGFRVVDELVRLHGSNWYDRGIVQTAEIEIHDRPITVFKSNTYMNDSGKIIPFMLKKGIKTNEILVIHDELEKKLGTHPNKIGVSHRGHNGLRSIVQMCSDDFYRLRIGIGRPVHKEEVPTYVLEPFDVPAPEIDTIITEAIELIINNL